MEVQNRYDTFIIRISLIKSIFVFFFSCPRSFVGYLSERPDDEREVPEKIQIELQLFLEGTYFPDVLNFLARQCLKPFFFIQGYKCAIRSLSPKRLIEYHSWIECTFLKENWNHLFLILKTIDYIPTTAYRKKFGKNLVGAAIHTIKYMGDHELERELREIVKDCFIPNNDPDLRDPFGIV